MTKGKIITIEGSDGSGKQTQKELLIKIFKEEGYKIRTLSFPDYSSFFGKTVEEYLDGKFGKLNQIHPKLSSLPFSLDRLQYKDQILNWLNNGGNWLFDRYMESNWGHQASILKGKEREGLIKWLLETETNHLGLPKSDLVIYLDLPIGWSQEAIYKQGRKKDIQESSLSHQLEVQETYRYLSSTRQDWVAVDCLRTNYENLPREKQRFSIREVSEKLREIIYPLLTKSKTKFYFCFSVAGDRKNLNSAKQIVGILENHGEVLSKHIVRDDVFEFENKNIEDGVNVYNRDMNWVEEGDYTIVEGSGNSFGVGREIERSTFREKPVLFLYNPNLVNRVSYMILHDKRITVKPYTNNGQLDGIIQEFLSKN